MLYYLILFAVAALVVLVIILRAKDAEQSPQEAFRGMAENVIYSMEETVDLSSDKLLVYQLTPSHKFLQPQMLPLPKKRGEYVSIIPVGGRPQKGAAGVLTLSRKGLNAGCISHQSPMLIYKSVGDGAYYCKVNSENYNDSTFHGDTVDEIRLEEVVTTENSQPKFFYLCGAPLCFKLLRQQEEPGELDLSDIVEEKTEKQPGHFKLGHPESKLEFKH